MNISIEKKKIEAIRRMKLLHIFRDTINLFANDDRVCISEPPYGAFFWAKGEDLERIKQFETANNALVYVVIRSYTSLGKMDSFLFVSDHPEDWELERSYLSGDIESWMHVAYVYNHDVPAFSESGIIGIAPTVGAGLQRTW